MKNPGIYILTNNVNGKQYVGKDSNMPKRAKRHLRGDAETSPAIHNAIKKHGRDVFSVQLIPYPNISHEALYAVEQWKIAQLGSLSPNGYNLTDKGSGMAKGKAPTPETRDKLSVAQTGKKHTQETCDKISAALTGEKHPNYGKTTPIKTRRKIAETLKKRKRKIV